VLRRLPSLLAAACLTSALLAAPAVADGPVASAAAACTISGKQTKLGATYVTSVRATGISCSRAVTLTRAYNACRKRNGGAKGRCASVSGFRCTERRRESPVQYDATATCRRGSAKVVIAYTQNT
jgi:hypothetical protein